MKNVAILKPVVFSDDRGSLEVLFENGDYCCKRTTSEKGIFRGLHIQSAPYGQKKTIWVNSGKILDICLNLDPKSENYGNLDFFELDNTSGTLEVPAIYAHGYLALEKSVVSYFCFGQYNESSELVIAVPDNAKLIYPKLATATLSEKDQKGLSIAEALNFFNSVAW